MRLNTLKRRINFLYPDLTEDFVDAVAERLQDLHEVYELDDMDLTDAIAVEVIYLRDQEPDNDNLSLLDGQAC